jgi:hypothetical protein
MPSELFETALGVHDVALLLTEHHVEDLLESAKPMTATTATTQSHGSQSPYRV